MSGEYAGWDQKMENLLDRTCSLKTSNTVFPKVFGETLGWWIEQFIEIGGREEIVIGGHENNRF